MSEFSVETAGPGPPGPYPYPRDAIERLSPGLWPATVRDAVGAAAPASSEDMYEEVRTAHGYLTDHPGGPVGLQPGGP